MMRWQIAVLVVGTVIGVSSSALFAVERLVPSEYSTIQAAINDCNNGDVVIVEPNTYTGPGNKELDFGGLSIIVQSTDPNDPCVTVATVIDCQGSGRGFNFHSAETSSSIVAGLKITNGSANLGAAIYCDGSSPTIRNCIFTDNSASTSGGGIYNIDNSNPTVTNCTFSGNSANYGGGIYNIDNSNPTVTNCTFSGNSANYGGGMYNQDNCNPIITNCVFSGNTALLYGGGIFTYAGSPIVVNCTFSGDSAVRGGGICSFDSDPNVTNCILWGNSAAFGPQIYNEGTGSVTVAYSDIEGGWAGTGNINQDPCFVDANGADNIVGTEDDNLRLSAVSPCIDAGDNTAVPADTSDLDGDGNTTEPIPFDLDSNPRILYGVVDMGAYERGPTTIYVDADAVGNNNGSSWSNAFNFLQDALTVAVSGDQIWVAEGTYKPDANSSIPGGTGSRTATFQLINGVAIYGGFAGGESSLEERDWQTNETILSGDINTPGDDSDNSYHIVTGSGTEPNAVLDGFTITAGNANGSYPHYNGGGMYNFEGSPIVSNCTFQANEGKYGAGMFNHNSRPSIESCVFSGNQGYSGIGVYNSQSSPTLTNCIFTGNSAGTGSGGGVLNSNSSPTLIKCSFIGNSAGGAGGGGVYNRDDSSPVLMNCLFTGNVASSGSGGAINHYSGCSAVVVNCTFVNNTAGHRGGAVVNYGLGCMSLTITNCILFYNNAPSGPQIFDHYGTISVSFSNVQGGVTGKGNINTDPCFVDATGGDYHLRGDSACVNAGDPDYIPTPGETDIDGEPRIMGGRVDMGADELTSTSGPVICLTPTKLDFYADKSGPNPKPQILSICNGGVGVLNWAISHDCNWLAVDPATGSSTGTGDPNEVSLRIDLSGLAWGKYYTCTLTVDDPCATNNPRMVKVVLHFPNNIIYVDANAPGPIHDGTSWSKAFKYLQDALAVAQDGNDVWVAQGTYTPDRNSADPNGSGDSMAAFSIINGVAIRGGYAGYGEPDPNGRDINLYETVLSGDLNGNDVGNQYDPSRTDNSRQVLTSIGNDGTAVLDGLTITAGRVYGIVINGGRPTLTNCTFRGNSDGTGHAIYNSDGSPTLINCTIRNNVGDFGAGMSNRVPNVWYLGTRPLLINCRFNGNVGTLYGGAMHADSYCAPTLINCTFSKNVAGKGAAIFCMDKSLLVNCTLSGNAALGQGGAIWPGNPILINCIVWGNLSGGMPWTPNPDPDAPAIDAAATISYSCVQDGNPGVGNIAIDPRFVREPNLVWDEIDWDGSEAGEDRDFGDLHLRSYSPCIDAGDNTAVPPDTADLDGDGNTTEPVPFDLDSRARIADGDCNDTDIVDMGAYEFDWAYIGDFEGNCDVDFVDFAIFAPAWLSEEGEGNYDERCDISIPADNYIDWRDLDVLAANWLAGL